MMPNRPERLWPESVTILERAKGGFFALWDELLQLRRAVLKTSDPDDIHDLRVATRRFRAALDLYYPFAPKGPKTELKKQVRRLTRVLGGLRNIDEALLFFPARGEGGMGGSSLGVRLTEQRARELKQIHKALTAFDHCYLDRVVRGLIAGLNEESIAEWNSISLLAYFSDASIRLFLPIHQLLVVATAPDQRASRHALRIAIKKWRYFLEIVAPILDRDYADILGQLKEYQSILGRMNDLVEFERLLDALDLSGGERASARAILRKEDTDLMHGLAELVAHQTLTYTFLI